MVRVLGLWPITPLYLMSTQENLSLAEFGVVGFGDDEGALADSDAVGVSQVGKFMHMLRNSPKHMSKIKKTEIYKVVKRIEKDSLPDGLSGMTEKVFFNKVDKIIQYNVFVVIHFALFVLEGSGTKKRKITMWMLYITRKRMKSFPVKIVKEATCLSLLFNITKQCIIPLQQK